MEAMMNEIFNFKIIYDNSLILAIVAINMTVIGLTSLAESKSIMGIDYGKFLIKKYKVFNFVKIYYLLIVFAIINVTALFALFIDNNKLTVIFFIILVLSLIFGIYYFFAYVMIENRFVRKQIYMQELLGLYYDSDKKTTFEVDKLVKISNGSGTNKKISSDVINYFNNFNGDSQNTFCEVFGAESIIYKSTRRLNRKRIIYGNLYVYREGKNGVRDISHEFFQFFRFTELQDKWAIDILKIINKDHCVDKGYEKIRLYNFTRIITHINVFGYNEAIYKYKFLEYIIEFFYNAIKISEEELTRMGLEEKGHIMLIEEYAINQIIEYIMKTIETKKDVNFINSSKKVLKKIAFEHEYFGVSELKDRFGLLLDNVINFNNNKVKELFTQLLSEYYDEQNNINIPEFMKIEEVKNYIKNYDQGVENTSKLKVEDLF
jgi:hypothetical protein